MPVGRLLNEFIYGGNADDLIFTHKHRLSGSISAEGVPAEKMVLVFNKLDYSFIAATMSRADGVWSISGLPEYSANSLLVVAVDPAGTYNALVFDRVSQVHGEDYTP